MVWIVLAVEGCVPLWAAANVPGPFLASPQPLLSIARDTLAISPDSHGSTAGGFDRVEAEYGREATIELVRWGDRNFVSRKDDYRAALWSFVFIRLARLSGQEAAERDLALAPERKSRLLGEITASFGPPRLIELDGLARAAKQVPLSAIEDRLIALEPQSDPLSTMTHFPVVETLTGVVHSEWARAIWASLGSWLDATERAEFVRWARHVGESLRMRPEDLVPLA